MKFYIASKFSLLERVRELSRALERAGHEITVKWWSRKYDIPGEGKVQTTDLKKIYNGLPEGEFYNRPETAFSYDSEFKGVKDADVFILIAGDKPGKFNGANIELGIALSDSKPCYSVGPLENSVLYYPVKKFKTIPALLGAIKIEEVEP